MSVSEHPVALTIEQRVGGATVLLATVMALPLLDGLFVALLLAGTLETTVGMLETGLLVFGGSATVAVILAELDESRGSMVRSVLLIGAGLIPLAALQAVIAPTIESALELAVFQRFAGVVILAIAARTVSAKVSDYLPSPGVIILLGLLASIRPSALTVELVVDGELLARAAITAAIGVGFALAVALAAPALRGVVDLDRFRFGSAVALGVFALPVVGVLDTDAPIALAVLIVSGLLAYSPDGGDEPEQDAEEPPESATDTDYAPEDTARAPWL
ncbi:hypothetical protein DM826_00650 [Halonotius aquaticus]|uniref:Uncharacterized protein n=1 Tax=Halonotius aquaticus TaxID=2216978 RepID=A0A3A6Q736_9EURY|nr:DUF5794 domain-containing protein [Halonotius aquaticus]RJX45238.1 hypothetical protein DM826_00650 [Halonotius aquaticus]